jgi:hypothetical protein
MSDITEQLSQLTELLGKVTQQSAPQSNGWNQTQSTAGALNIQGVGVPVAIQTPAGKVRCTFFLGAEHAQTPQALMQALEQMTNLGMPLDAWQEKSSGGNWGGNSNNNGYKKRW